MSVSANSVSFPILCEINEMRSITLRKLFSFLAGVRPGPRRKSLQRYLDPLVGHGGDISSPFFTQSTPTVSAPRFVPLASNLGDATD